ncbi:MAG: hypothetical protein LBQ84_07995, partial [Flavobacteriaceae bacterium]|nr:hypothetical protein [Flavobacteriaceae bacterium]
MKRILKISVAFLSLFTGININAQFIGYTALTTSLAGSSYFLDASKFQNEAIHNGRLLGFPRTDLTSFIFNIEHQGDGITSENNFDGVLIFNYGTGTTPENTSGVSGWSWSQDARVGAQAKVTPGFYYFSNPTAAPTGINLNSSSAIARWRRLSGADYVTNYETETNITIGGKPVYSYTGSFTLPPNNRETNIVLNGSTPNTSNPYGTLPDAISTAISTGVLYKVTIYNKAAAVFTNTVYSFNPGTKTLVTGAPNISV